MKIGGYINVTNKNSKLMKDKKGKKFIETVVDGAFEKALIKAKMEKRQIPLLWRHKEDKVLATNVELKEDQIGLRFEAEVDEDIYNTCKDNDIRCSFGFEAIKDKITNITDNFYKRVLEDINLLEVTLTRPSYAAYDSSIAECREEVESKMEIREILDTLNVLTKEVEKLCEERELEDKKEEKKLDSKDDKKPKEKEKADNSKEEVEEKKEEQEKDKKEEVREIEFDTDFYTKILNELK